MMHYKLTFALPITVIFLLLVISWRVYGYAEIHYTFFRYSLIRRGCPEILLDVPWRVDAGKPIPVVCIVKDADRFPIELNKITARYSIDGGETLENSLFPIPAYAGTKPLHISDHYWSMLTFLYPPQDLSGSVEVALEAEFMKDSDRKIISSDNLPGLSHAPFNVYISPYELPTFDGWYCGDPHYHSDMTQDQVEFGAPIEVAVEMGKAMGLKWLAVADHSYDLDRAIGEFFEHDAKLTRWQKVLDDASYVNSKDDGFIVIPAEEVSCGNSKSHNVHLLAFNTRQFIPGKGDGVKKGLNKRPDLTLRQCLSRVNRFGGFAYAAHPEVGNGFLGTLLLNRDHWREPDYGLGGYCGLQFWNGALDKKFDRSKEKWIQLLLEGRRLYVLGGNDAHGDFNRCRKVKYPNTKLAESVDHIFGKARTYAYCGKNTFSLAGILDALKNGRTIVTNGPIVILRAQNNMGQTANVGDDIVGRDFILTISACSSEEYGPVDRINLYKGDLLSKLEQIEATFIPEGSSSQKHIFTHRIANTGKCYVRAEAMSSTGGEQYMCLTNPIWLRSA